MGQTLSTKRGDAPTLVLPHFVGEESALPIHHLSFRAALGLGPFGAVDAAFGLFAVDPAA